MTPRVEADGKLEDLARKISVDQAHAHAERHLQTAVDNLAYWAMRMVEANDAGEVVSGQVRDAVLIALHEVQALTPDTPVTPEAVGFWFDKFLARRSEEQEAESTASQPSRNGRKRKVEVVREETAEG